MKNHAVAAFSIIVLLGVSSAFAAPSRKRAICPAYVANKSEGIAYPGDKFLCFKNSKDAVKLGVKRLSSMREGALTGWWRLNVNLKSNTCPNVPSDQGKVTMFLQVKENSEGLFADTCPGGDRYVGQRLLNNVGYTLTALKTLKSDSSCNGDPSQIAYLIKVQGLTGRDASQVSYRVIRTCLGATTGSEQCHTEWQGNGGQEKPSHQFWPTVPSDLGQFGVTCASALTKCADCHNKLPLN